jgi:hypothetical protein
MRQDGNSSWINFKAKQTIALTSCAFVWRARVGPAGLVLVQDALKDGIGSLDVRMLGIVPIAYAGRTTALTRGQLMRYMAELAWANAILFNTQLRWRKDSERHFAVRAGSGATAADVNISLDSEGRIVEVFAPDRPRLVKSKTIPTPWRGRFSDYRRVGGTLLPYKGEVGWVIDNELIICWQGRLENWNRETVR